MKKIDLVTKTTVGLTFDDTILPVGILALRDGKIYFEYSPSFIETELEISPVRLPLRRGVTTFDPRLFEGLPGVFNDSLPDGWGRLLFDRFLRAQGVVPSRITPLDRLCHTGMHGLGALVFEPNHNLNELLGSVDLDHLYEQAIHVLEGTYDHVLKDLLSLNGSSAGARPKALLGVGATHQHMVHGAKELPDGYDPWIVKFANTQDGLDAGALEYVYALMAKDAGIHMPEIHLFPGQKNAGYFGVKRFDRAGRKRFHMHTACGLLHSDFRTPSLDYDDLITLTSALTRDVREVEKMYRLAVFNVLAHNRDDHSKNFSFLMDHTGKWSLAPAYDLTFSSGLGAEQSTTVMGEGRNPAEDHLLSLGKEAKIPQPRIHDIINQTKSALSNWKNLAKEYGVSAQNIELISKNLLI